MQGSWSVSRRQLAGWGSLVALGAATATRVRAQSEAMIRIGVLSDMSGPFADQDGPGSVLAVQMAAQEVQAALPGLRVEVVSADHQNRPDVGVAIARRWVDQEGVAAIVGLPNSGVALAVSNLMREKNRATLASISATSALTGSACQPTTVQWMTDTWAQSASTVQAVMRQGGADTWFFLTVDYALGSALEQDATAALARAGGRAFGRVRVPLGTTDFASPLLQAQGSGARVLCIATTGTDAANAIKQAFEFGLAHRGTRVAALFMVLQDIQALGLRAAQGLFVTTGFYWDMSEASREFAQRYAARAGGRMPGEGQAAAYDATRHYLRSIADAPSLDGLAAIEAMKRRPVEKSLFGVAGVRADGRAVHPMYLFRVKAPAESRGVWDIYERIETIPADQAFRPLAEGGCSFIRS